MSGLSRQGFQPLTGWAHVEQSIGVILTTPIGSRVERREFGSRIPDILDAPQNRFTIVNLMVETADALDLWETRFLLTNVGVNHAGDDGHLGLYMRGDERLRAHLGDFTVTGQRSIENLVVT
ncbi:MAG: GPW/gp25 family protein [Pseudomonadota bacterium]